MLYLGFCKTKISDLFVRFTANLAFYTSNFAWFRRILQHNYYIDISRFISFQARTTQNKSCHNTSINLITDHLNYLKKRQQTKYFSINIRKELLINKSYFNVLLTLLISSLQDNLYKVLLPIKIQATSTDEGSLVFFDIKLTYPGLFIINSIDNEKQKETILMIHCSTLIFSYACRVLSDVTRDGEFQPITLEHVDFVRLYQQRKAQKELSESVRSSVN